MDKTSPVFLALESMKPPPDIDAAQWACVNRFISDRYTNFPGLWRHDRSPYLVEIMEVMCDPLTREVDLKLASQLGKSEVLLNYLGWALHTRPGSKMVVQPTIKLAEKWGKGRVRDLISSSPPLRKMQGIGFGDKVDGTMSMFQFPGTELYLVGANSATDLASTPIKDLLLDEVNRYPDSVGNEGSPIELVQRRTQSYGDEAKMIRASSPTRAHEPISKNYMRGDQREYFLPCPHCDEFMRLDWELFRCLADGEKMTDKNPNLLDDPYFICIHCGGQFHQHHRDELLSRGKWIKKNPKGSHPSFFIWAAYSRFVDWRTNIAQKWIEVKDDAEDEIAFTNTVLGLDYTDPEEKPLSIEAGNIPRFEKDALPEWAIMLTAGIDVHGDRLEVQFVAIGGTGYDRLLIAPMAHIIIKGDPLSDDTWQALRTAVKSAKYSNKNGTLGVDIAAIDEGYYSNQVQHFVYAYEQEGYRAVKGASQPQANIIGGIVGKSAKRPMTSHRANARLIDARYVGSSEIKNLLDKMIATNRVEFASNLDEVYFNQLRSEIKVKRMINGQWHYRWINPSAKRNEALDCLVYAIAAAFLLNLNVNQWVKRFAILNNAKINKERIRRKNATMIATITPPTKQPVKKAKPTTSFPSARSIFRRPRFINRNVIKRR